MDRHDRMKIKFSDISLDINNFRHGKVSSEREAITVFLSNEKKHGVAELAQDIVHMKKLDPSSLLIVMEDTTAPHRYIVLEGNRRITALKTMATPSLAQNLPTHNIFQNLNPSFLALKIDEIECVVLDKEEAFEWIKRKHYKGMGGRGTEDWDAIATARADAVEGKPSRWMIALDAISAQGLDEKCLLNGIEDKTTTVERVLGTGKFSEVLGISFDLRNRAIKVDNGDDKAAAHLLKTMLEDMADKSFIVSIVDNAKQQTEFIQKYIHLNVKKNTVKPASNPGNSTTSSTQNNNNGTTGTGGNTSNSSNSTPGQGITGTQNTRAKPVKDRVVLADKGLSINNDALNKLYNQLRKLNVEKNPHISSVMIRIFLEKTTMVFLEDMKIKCPNRNGWQDHNVKLRDKVKAALDTIDPNKQNSNLKYARDVANAQQQHIHSLDYLNRAIHDHKAMPAPSELITIWDRFQEYFLEIFNTLKANGK